MSTRVICLEDFDVLTASATVLSMQSVDGGAVDVVLDVTPFYPRGGGQDSDSGTITLGSSVFEVDSVRKDEYGAVHHCGTFGETAGFVVGALVHAEVDGGRRDLNTRLHSAGHLIDIAVERLGYAWIPGKGAHFPDMSFVEYEIAGPDSIPEGAIDALDAELGMLIAAGGDNSILVVPASEVHKYMPSPPDYIANLDEVRLVRYGETAIACGGTHVRSIDQVIGMSITKLKRRGNTLRVSYSVV